MFVFVCVFVVLFVYEYNYCVCVCHCVCVCVTYCLQHATYSLSTGTAKQQKMETWIQWVITCMYMCYNWTHVHMQVSKFTGWLLNDIHWNRHCLLVNCTCVN